MGVLPHQDIVRLGNAGVIGNFDAGQVKTASYDMRVGLEYYVHEGAAEEIGTETARALDKFLIEKLDDKNAGIVLSPNAVVIISLHERLYLPADIVGHLSLKVEFLLRGLIMANQSQIDAGYRGPIFALLYNLSTEHVVLKHLDEIVRLELNRMEVATTQTYEGSFTPDKGLRDVLRQPVGSSLRELSLRIDALRSVVDEKVKRLTISGIAALGLSIASIIGGFLVGFFGPWSDQVHNVGELQGQQSGNVGEFRVQEAQIRHLESQVKMDQRRLATLIAQFHKRHRQHRLPSAGGGK